MSDTQSALAFGRYTDPVMLGQGGMGAVYRALDPSLDRFVAIKVLTHREPKYVERFRREAQVLAKIMHPSIIQIYEIVGTDEDQSDPYIVMEFFDGKPLDSALKDGPLAGPLVMSILRQTAEGLTKAHKNNVIHRDIKPANIMLSDSGEVKILDFGIAKLRDAKKDLTGNTVLGTPYYMSPEQAMGQPIDARTDIYSLGITAFHLLTGRKPFEAKSKVDVMLAQVKTPLPSIHDFVECDPRIVEIIERMCAKQAKDRYQSCEELLEAIEGLPRSLGGKQAETEPTVLSVPKTPASAPKAQPRTQSGARAPQTPSAPRTMPQKSAPRTPAAGPKPSSRPDVRRPSAPPKPAIPRLWIAIGGGAAVVLVAVILAFALGGKAGSARGRVPAEGWRSAGALKRLNAAGFGNCVFSSKEIDRGASDDGALRNSFGISEPIYGRCFFPRQVGPNKPGEIWQELWIDGVKRAQIIYDPALQPDDDQLGLEISRRHASRLGELSSGKHILDVWIYRQPDDADNPVPLAAGELVVRK
ncbi:MAG TPA: protein kinase [Myxococcales bacterium]|nr:protein kinase [Myxococcales bacterium]